MQDLPLFIFLDKICLIDGDRWDRGFMVALSRSACFAPLLSAGSLQKMLGASADTVDNLLLEWATAIELASRQVILKIVPLFVDGFWEALETHRTALSSSADGAPLKRVEATLCEHLMEITGNGSIDGLKAALSLHAKAGEQQQRVAASDSNSSGNYSTELTPLAVINVLCSYQGQTGAQHQPSALNLCPSSESGLQPTRSSIQNGRQRLLSLSDQSFHPHERKPRSLEGHLATLAGFVQSIERAVGGIDTNARAATFNAGGSTTRQLEKAAVEDDAAATDPPTRTPNLLLPRSRSTEAALADALVQLLELRAANAGTICRALLSLFSVTLSLLCLTVLRENNRAYKTKFRLGLHGHRRELLGANGDGDLDSYLDTDTHSSGSKCNDRLPGALYVVVDGDDSHGVDTVATITEKESLRRSKSLDH